MADRNFDEALEGLETGAEETSEDGAPRGDSADAASHPSVPALRGKFGDAVLHHTIVGRGEHVVYVAAEQVRPMLSWLRDDPAQSYGLLLDLTAVDYGGGRPLEVLYQLISVEHDHVLRLKVTLPLTALEVDSVVSIYNSANWMEREAYDMFGIHFRGHPDLRRILMPNNYAEGHPLRKDFPLRGRFTRAEQTRRALSMAVEDFYTPHELRVGRVLPEVQAVTRDETVPGPDPAQAAADPSGTTGRPNDEDWSPGVAGTAASGAPGPSGPGGAGA
jgi:NADH-quinone oxidoreductase subunit C